MTVQNYDPEKKPQNVTEAAREYIHLRESHDIAKSTLKRIRSDLDAAERKMIECFLDNDTTSMQISDLTVSIAQSCRISITLGNTPAWLEWLKTRNLEPQDYLREEIVGKNLRETVREVLKHEGRLALPEALPIDETPTARVRGWAAYMKNMGIDGLKDDDDA